MRLRSSRSFRSNTLPFQSFSPRNSSFATWISAASALEPAGDATADDLREARAIRATREEQIAVERRIRDRPRGQARVELVDLLLGERLEALAA